MNMCKRQQRYYLKRTIARRDRVLFKYRDWTYSFNDEKVFQVIFNAISFMRTHSDILSNPRLGLLQGTFLHLNSLDSKLSPSILRNQDRVNSFVRILFSTLG